LAMNTGQIRGAGTCMVPSAIPECVAIVQRQTAEHADILTKLLERLEDARVFEVRSGTFRPPVVHDHAGGCIDKAQAIWGIYSSSRGSRERRRHCVEHRQPDRNSDASQK